jgi:hypothetical protein
MTATGVDLSRAGRVFATVLAGVLIALSVWETADVWQEFASRNGLGQDWAFYVSLGRRWLDSGVLYGDRQLTGTYHVLVNVDNLYPPPSILVFAAFAVVPTPLSALVWWGMPLGLLVKALVKFRSSPWTWPLMAACVFWPRSLGSLVAGNSDLLSAGFVAGGLIWGWPGVLGVFKPSFGPFALTGIRRRSWWVGLGLVALVSLPFLLGGAWSQYLIAVSHWDLPWDRSILNVPLLLIPVLAWLGRRSGPVSSAPVPGGTS